MNEECILVTGDNIKVIDTPTELEDTREPDCFYPLCFY